MPPAVRSAQSRQSVSARLSARWVRCVRGSSETPFPLRGAGVRGKRQDPGGFRGFGQTPGGPRETDYVFLRMPRRHFSENTDWCPRSPLLRSIFVWKRLGPEARVRRRRDTPRVPQGFGTENAGDGNGPSPVASGPRPSGREWGRGHFARRFRPRRRRGCGGLGGSSSRLEGR